jgi:DNA-binding NarL/FixJ family response regulator
MAARSEDKATNRGELTANGVAGSRCVSVVVGRFAPLLARGLADVLREDPGIEVVAHDLDAVALAEAVAQHRPRVAVINPETEAEMREWPGTRSARTGLLVLASDPSLAYGLLRLAAGVACIPLGTSPSGLIAAVHRLARGERVFLALNGHRYFDTALLTPRELEVLEYLCLGQSPNAIAPLMNIRVRTVRAHTESLRRKLGVRTTRELIVGTHEDSTPPRFT